jgi:hypothetical protein
MRRAMAVLVVGAQVVGGAALCGCAEDEQELVPQTPVAIRARDFRYGLTAPADQPSTVYVIERPVDQYRATEIYPMGGYSFPPPRRTVSLGYIGDWPVGRFDGGGGHGLPWWRPFPARWLRDSYRGYRGRYNVYYEEGYYGR